MPATAMVAIDGVLARPSERVVESVPIPTGLALYLALSDVYRMVLVSTDPDRDALLYFLRYQGISGYAELLAGPSLGEPPVEVVRGAQLTGLRSRGTSVELVVDAAPAVIAMAMHRGVTGLLFAHPKYAYAEFRPDAVGRVRPWDLIEAEMANQDRLRVGSPPDHGGVFD